LPVSEAAASGLIREARRRAGVRQAELARRAGLPRSVLNAYERGRRQPSAAALVRIVGAAGLRLQLTASIAELDDQRASRILEQVLDLAEQLPNRRRGRLAYPPFRQRLP
jgi:transcriptional regulator with XRE-family HTH domain